MISNIKDILGLIISLSTIFGIFTGIVNKIFNSKLKPINDRIERTEEQQLKQRMSTLRFEIVQFSSELRKGTHKTKYEYDAIFEFINEYNEYVKRLGIQNGLFSLEEENIRERYKQLKD